MYNIPKLKIFTSCESHYSVDRAAVMSGIGKENVVKIKTNKYHQIDIKDLERAINECIKNNDYPLIVISTLGTTV